EDTDHAEHQSVAVEQLAPFGEWFGRKDLVEDLDELDRASMAIRLGRKARIVDQLFPPETAGERGPLALLVQQRQDDPATALALVVIGHRIQCALARAPLAELRAAKFGLCQHGSRPDAVRHQVRGDMRALAGAL